jgi:cell wall assembly regulator SMI1
MLDVGNITSQLNEVGYDASVNRGVSEEDINAFSERTGITVPEDLRLWWRWVYDCSLSHVGFFNIRSSKNLDVEGLFGLFPLWKDRAWIPLANDGCGNFYLLAARNDFGIGHPVFFVDSASDPNLPAYIVASDMDHFLTGVLVRELEGPFAGWPFDRDAMLEFDPQMAKYRGLPFPWD